MVVASTFTEYAVGAVPRGGAGSRAPDAGQGQSSLHHLRSLVLLGGSPQPNLFVKSIARSVLDLPVDVGWSLLDLWCDQVKGVQPADGRWPVGIRILKDRLAPAPRVDPGRSSVPLVVERDHAELRGTGGVLRDVTADAGEGDRILVAHAAQILTEPLRLAARHLARSGGDVAVVAHESGEPSSLCLLRCACLRVVPAIGFVDLKEQALPVIARTHSVRVHRRQQPVGLSVRTAGEYIAALRWFHQSRLGGLHVRNPFHEDGDPAFAIVEAGAKVDRSARVLDSVVLDGARVEAGATLVRSVVCPGAVVRRGARVVDGLVTA